MQLQTQQPQTSCFELLHRPRSRIGIENRTIDISADIHIFFLYRAERRALCFSIVRNNRRARICSTAFKGDLAGVGMVITDSVQLGDLPGIGMTIIDGIVRTQRSRNTPPATRVPEVVKR